MDEYISIACAFHEQLEFAVLRRNCLNLRYLDETAGEREMDVLPTDVATRDKAEWLSYRTSTGEEGTIRLDRILAARAVA